MIGRVGQVVLGSLFGDTNKLQHPANEADKLECQLVEAYYMGIRRGLTPSDALAVAAALANPDKRSLWSPELAKRIN